MNLNRDPKQVVLELLDRSVCSVQVSSCIVDCHNRIIAHGWNHVGDGYGQHAEMHALSRANPNRLVGASIYVAAQRFRNKKIILSRPCEECMPHLRGLTIWWRNKEGQWVR